MASLNSKSGKCSNFGNCTIADARSTVEVPTGLDFVCNECGKPLLLTGSGEKGGSSQNLLIVGGLVAALLVAGGAAWFVLGKKTVEPVPAPAPPPVVQQAPAASEPAPPPAAPQTEPPAKPPVNGHCSAADERAGLCRIAP